MFEINKKFALNLQLFNEDINLTTSATPGNDLSPQMRTFYSDYLLDNAKPYLVHDQFGQKHPIPKNGGKTIQFRKYSPFAKALTPLQEGVTPNGTPLDNTTITAEVNQYGAYTRVSDVLTLTAVDNQIAEANVLLGNQAGETLDTITREVLVGGKNVQYAGGVSARSALGADNKLTVEECFKAARFLKTQKAKKINGYFVAIIHPDVAYDLMRSAEWVSANQYAGSTALFEGEIGRMAGIRFVETTEAKIFEKAGAGGKDVYATLVLGADAYGVTEVTGGGLEFIYKPLGSGEDPLNQRSTCGWKAMKTAEILVEAFMVRIESCSTFDSGAN